MAKAIKEIILALLVCLVGILLFAVVLYKFLPSRKVVPEVVQYTATEEVKELLADKIDEEEDKIILTYEVTSRDLNTYEANDDYVPGKANPFAAVVEEVEPTDSNTNSGNNTNSSSNSNSTSEDDNSGSAYIRNNGTK